MTTKKIIPLFKTHYSIGKSILTLDDPNKRVEGGSDSVFSIAKDNNLNHIILVEDSLVGFFEAYNRSKEMGIDLTFGLRLSMRNSKEEEEKESEHKIIIFAKNGKGCKLLNKIYSKAFCKYKGFLIYEDLQILWDENLLKMAIPFYDSFIYVNNFLFGNVVPNISFTKPVFFIEKNGLALDRLLEKKVNEFCNPAVFPTELVKSIYYKDNKDVESYMAYKILCNRSFGKSRSLSRPELSHFCSNEFSFESWKYQNS